MSRAEVPTSPRIRALQAAIAEDPSRGLEITQQFWDEVAQSGTPLVEPAESPDRRLVTFVWRDRERARQTVVVVGGPATWSPVQADAMNRLDDIFGIDSWICTRGTGIESSWQGWISPGGIGLIVGWGCSNASIVGERVPASCSAEYVRSTPHPRWK